MTDHRVATPTASRPPERMLMPRDQAVTVAKAVHDAVMDSVKALHEAHAESVRKTVKDCAELNEQLVRELTQRVQTLQETFNARMGQQLTPHLQDMRDAVEAQMRAVRDELSSHYQSHAKRFERSLDDVRRAVKDEVETVQTAIKSLPTAAAGPPGSGGADLVDMTVRMSKMLEDKVDRKLATFSRDHSERLADLDRKCLEAVRASHERYEAGLGQVKDLLEALKAPVFNIHTPQQPAPVVNVPELSPIFRVEVPQQAAPHVDVHVPEQQAPTVINQVPESRSIVNVQVPEQRAPDVHVAVPKPRLTRKTIKYDSLGRPVEFFEHEVEDTEEKK